MAKYKIFVYNIKIVLKGKFLWVNLNMKYIYVYICMYANI